MSGAIGPSAGAVMTLALFYARKEIRAAIIGQQGYCGLRGMEPAELTRLARAHLDRHPEIIERAATVIRTDPAFRPWAPRGKHIVSTTEGTVLMAAEAMVYVIRVQPPGGSPKSYVVIADEGYHAEALVGDYCKVTNQKVELVQVLPLSYATRLGLKPGEVKPYD